MENITDILQEKAQDILTEATLQHSEEAFTTKVQLPVEAALVKQDDEYAAKLEHLLEAIDLDHSKKLDKVVEAIDKNHAEKMIAVVEKYSKALTTEAAEFKNDIVNKVSKYLDIYLEKLVPQKSINEAVKNKRANKMLSEMRKVLAVDAALQKQAIKDAIVDGKSRIDESTAQVDEMGATLNKLSKENAVLKAQLTLESKCSDLSEDKAAFCKKVLTGKSAKFINENFDYTLKMFDKNHEEHLEVLHEQAKRQNSVSKDVDRPTEVIKESTEQSGTENPYFNAYLGELGKY
jgi:CHASE3 domain sensor protein